jgi:hypothetical protein
VITFGALDLRHCLTPGLTPRTSRYATCPVERDRSPPGILPRLAGA